LRAGVGRGERPTDSRAPDRRGNRELSPRRSWNGKGADQLRRHPGADRWCRQAARWMSCGARACAGRHWGTGDGAACPPASDQRAASTCARPGRDLGQNAQQPERIQDTRSLDDHLLVTADRVRCDHPEAVPSPRKRLSDPPRTQRSRVAWGCGSPRRAMWCDHTGRERSAGSVRAGEEARVDEAQRHANPRRDLTSRQRRTVVAGSTTLRCPAGPETRHRRVLGFDGRLCRGRATSRTAYETTAGRQLDRGIEGTWRARCRRRRTGLAGRWRGGRRAARIPGVKPDRSPGGHA